MTADEILEDVIRNIDKGIEKCNRYPEAKTTNEGVEYILTQIKGSIIMAQREIYKGNVK